MVSKNPFANQLRHHETPTETILWKHLRNRQLGGLKFRRQYPIGIYIADFYCSEKKLIIEVDGDIHYQDGAQAKDEIRQDILESSGYRVLRFTTVEVREQLNAVLERILQEVCQ